jgi:hypothetical protein
VCQLHLLKTTCAYIELSHGKRLTNKGVPGACMNLLEIRRRKVQAGRWKFQQPKVRPRGSRRLWAALTCRFVCRAPTALLGEGASARSFLHRFRLTGKN